MHPHPSENVDLLIHDDQELSEILQSPILSRETLHEWPLSHVEKITLPNQTLVYKARRSWTAELDFHRAHMQNHTPHIRSLVAWRSRLPYHWLWLEYIEGIPMQPMAYDEAQATGAALLPQIAALEVPGLPYRHNLSATGLPAFVDTMASRMGSLYSQGYFHQTTPQLINAFTTYLDHETVFRVASAPCGLLHGDFKPDNVLVQPDGSPSIIDWESIAYGPAQVDMCAWLAMQGHDPVPVYGIGAEILRLAHEAYHLVDCACHWLPFYGFFDKQVSTIIETMAWLLQHGTYAGTEVYYFH